MFPGTNAPDDAELVARLVKGGAATARPVYGSVLGNQVTFGIRARDSAGIMTATISLPIMLERHIPWWIAEQYGVRIAASDGPSFSPSAVTVKPIPAPSKGTRSRLIRPCAVPWLQILPHASGKTSANLLLTAAIAGLSAFAILALVALYRNGVAPQAGRAAPSRGNGFSATRWEDSLTVGLRAKDHEGRVLYVNAALLQAGRVSGRGTGRSSASDAVLVSEPVE